MKQKPYGFSIETTRLPETEVTQSVTLTFLTFRWVGKDQRDLEVSFATSMDPWFMADNLRKMADFGPAVFLGDDVFHRRFFHVKRARIARALE